eukprot:6318946-Amphidinium_carterae.1
MPDLEFSQDDVELVTDKINKIGELITAAQSNVRIARIPFRRVLSVSERYFLEYGSTKCQYLRRDRL